MKEPTLVIDLSNQDTKRRLLQKISAMSGLHEVLIRPRKRVRTLQQCKYYFVAVATPFCHWLREQYGDEAITVDEAHELLKRRVLKPREGVNKHTGEVMKLARTTTTLTTAEFSDYVEKCAHFLADFAGVVVLPADAYFESPSPKPSETPIDR